MQRLPPLTYEPGCIEQLSQLKLVQEANNVVLVMGACIQLLEQQEDIFYLKKYAKVGALLTGCDELDVKTSCRNLTNILEQWVSDLEIPKLGEFGIYEEDLDNIVDKTSYKYNPVALNYEQMKSVLRARL